ncbi:MAG: hypothetical protein HY876_03395 [Coriobacteriales bacterium]|nr:hypothetical protein [Coriobacteriales bacterium]
MLGRLLAIAKWLAVGTVVLVAAMVLGLVFVPLVSRPFTDRWGATDDEVSARLPGDDIFPAEREISTKAITIDAPPEVVYALVQQMGQHRAGWYGWDWFYNATGSSDFVDGHYSTRIVPELQGVKAGDTININDMVAYEVAEASPGSSFVLYAGSQTPAEWRAPSKPATWTAQSVPETWTANSMAWVMKPTATGGTRLLLRMRADGTDTGLARWIWDGPLNFGGALFSRKTMVGIKRTAEGLARK